MTTPVSERGALYYPYIHFRDINWLKATLLCFPRIVRMVPQDFPLNDSNEVRLLRDFKNAHGDPILSELSLDTGAIEQAQGRLLAHLYQADSTWIKHQYGEPAVLEAYQGQNNVFQIHHDKMLDNLICFLRSHDLVWEVRESVQGGNKWWGIHPALGEAIMSVSAIAAAGLEGLDIVTPSATVHQALAIQDEDLVFASLLSEYGTAQRPVGTEETIDELAHVVLTVMFDVSKLTVQDVCELVSDGADLYRFKNAIAEIAASMPARLGPDQRAHALRERAERVIEEWRKYQDGLPARFRRVFRDAATSHAEDTLKDAGKSLAQALAGGGVAAAVAGISFPTVVLGSAVGLAVSLITTGGFALFRRQSSPYQFLSRVVSAGAELLVVPKSSDSGIVEGI